MAGERRSGVGLTRLAKWGLNKVTGKEYSAPQIPFAVGGVVRTILSERSGWQPAARIQRALTYGALIGAGIVLAPALVVAGIATLPVVGAGLLGAAALGTAATFLPEGLWVAGTAASLPYYPLSILEKGIEGTGKFLWNNTIGRIGRRGRESAAEQ